MLHWDCENLSSNPAAYMLKLMYCIELYLTNLNPINLSDSVAQVIAHCLLILES